MAPTPQDDDGRADVSCSICKELFLPPCIPKLLDCSHTVCIKCLQKMGQLYTAIRCPLCMKAHKITGGLDSLPTNLAVQNFADKYNRMAIKKGEKSDASADTKGIGIFCCC